jgi:hypothetical protein
LACGVLALLYGAWTIRSVAEPVAGQCADAGNRRRDPGRRGAYLNRQYTTIAIVGVVIFASPSGSSAGRWRRLPDRRDAFGRSPAISA